MPRLLLLVLVAPCALAAASGCKRAPAGSELAAAGSAATPASSGELDPRDQYALLRDITAAQSAPLDERPARLEAVRSRWLGRRYRWEALFVAPLCRRPGACVVAPFDTARVASPVAQGWLPRLDLDDAASEGLGSSCPRTG